MPRAELLTAFLEETRARVDQALEQHLPKAPACPPLVSEAVRYSVFAGGKRLRPVLTLAAADAVARRATSGSQSLHALEAALPAACAVELIHTYSLIHDDLPAMDNDTLRRGRPTLHVVYGDGIAILAGDALQAEAFALLAREPGSSDPVLISRKLRVVQIVAEAAGAVGMVGGQAIDLQAAGQAPGHTLTLDAASLRSMHLRKTGALMRASAVSGAIMAGANPEIEQAVADWAAEVGLAFQIVDDILDVEGNPGELGKTVGKDAAGDKPTYPALFGLDGSRTMVAESRSRADAILLRAGLGESWLAPIGNWIATRKY